MTATVKTRFIYNIYPAALWVSENPVMLDREVGIEEDTGREKWGDGVTAWNSLAYAPVNLVGALLASQLDTDGTLAANSDAKVPSQKAVKTYVDMAVTGLLDFKGNTNCSGNPNYPAALKGDAYVVSAAGKIGGASGTSVEVGDVFVASADNAGGTQASVGASWFTLEHNLAGALLTSDLGVTVQNRSAFLDALAAIATNGLLARTGVGTASPRTLTGTANEIDIANGSGAAGNPTASLPAAMTLTGKTVTGGTFSGITLSGATALPGSGSITSGGRAALKASSSVSYHTFAENNAGDYAAHVKNDSASDGFGLLVSSASTAATSFALIDGYSSGLSSLRFRVQGNGNTQNANNSYGATSDAKLKVEVGETTSQWDEFKRLRFCKYRMKEDGPDGPVQLGLIAQDVEKIWPGVVETSDDVELVEVEGEDGPTFQRRLTGETTKGIKYSIVTLKAHLVLQEVQNRIEALERRMTAAGL